MPLSLYLTTEQPENVWLVQSGSLALFAIPISSGREGTRRYLFSVAAGDVFFPMSSHPNYRILAVAIAEPILIPVSVTELDQPDRQLDLLLWVRRWQEHLKSVLQDTKISLASIDTTTIKSWEALWLTLEVLHAEFFKALAQIDQQVAERKHTQLQQREALESQVTTQALSGLFAVLTPVHTAVDDGEDGLLIAMGALGRALGISICPPTLSEGSVQGIERLRAIAQFSQFRIRRVALDPDWWKTDCGPLLGYTTDQYPVALLPMSGGKYELLDPQTCTRTLINQKIASQISLTAYIFYRPLPERVIKALDLLQFALAGRAKDVFTAFWTGIAVTVLGMLTPQAIALLIDFAIPDANRTLLWQIGLGLLITSFGVATFQLIQRWIVLRLETIADLTIQAAVWDRLLRVRLSFLQQYDTGDLKTRVLSIAQIRKLLGGMTLSTIFTSSFALLNLVLLVVYSAPLAIVAVAVALTALLMTHSVRWMSMRYFRALQKGEGKLFGTMVQIIGGIAKLRVAGAENRAFAYWSKQYSQQLSLNLKAQFYEDMLTVFNTALPTLSAILLFGVAGALINPSQALDHSLSTGKFLAFNLAFATFISGATSLSNTLVKILEAGTLWERTQPILNAELEVDRSKADPGSLTGNLQLDRVSFRYRKDGPLVLDQITLEAKAGEFIALVGASGSGKSTILRLLLGFDIPEAGTVAYDDHNIASLDLGAVRRQLGVVLQNGRIISGSLLENIANGALVTLEDVWEATELAGLAEDIRALPMGLHTVIAEGGTNLSGGQRQRLLIARALILKPKILLLDEATSALDNRTQEVVSRNLEQLQVTRVAIAHRLSTIRHADRIYVLERGQLVQQGTFEQLSNQLGVFQKLMVRQLA